MIPSEISAYLLSKQSLSIFSAQPLGGGCIHNAHKISTNRGTLFLKWNALNQAHNFEVEAKGLDLLKSTHTIDTPSVIFRGEVESYAFLLLAFIESGKQAKDYWEQLGFGLAKLHQHSQQYFGLTYDNYIGALLQYNQPSEDWLSFFIAERLEKTIEMADRKGLINSGLRNRFEKFYKKLEGLLPIESPALIHGDLWGGNLMRGEKGQPVFFDPAVYYAHREIELAFMTLFDRQPSEFYSAYEEVFPLEAGYKGRFDIYNLYPLLVHVNLFGRSYLGGIEQTLRQYL